MNGTNPRSTASIAGHPLHPWITRLNECESRAFRDCNRLAMYRTTAARLRFSKACDHAFSSDERFAARSAAPSPCNSARTILAPSTIAHILA
jgi:hypothetical protein